MNKCAHPHCIVEKRLDQYACKPHCFGLPQAIRINIIRGYKIGKLSGPWLKADREAQAYWMKKRPPAPPKQQELFS